MNRKQRRLSLIAAAGLILIAATALTLTALSGKITLFQSPSDILAKAPPPSQRIRLGGLVADGSVVKEAGGRVRFAVTDCAKTLTVVYQGILPDLFREGQGVITEGTLGANGQFTADSVLAKHDENYMPPEVAKEMQARNQCQATPGKQAGVATP
ncbi:MAG: cytochrome c maturation protein CcmE [Bauldia sp.]